MRSCTIATCGIRTNHGGGWKIRRSPGYDTRSSCDLTEGVRYILLGDRFLNWVACLMRDMILDYGVSNCSASLDPTGFCSEQELPEVGLSSERRLALSSFLVGGCSILIGGAWRKLMTNAVGGFVRCSRTRLE